MRVPCGEDIPSILERQLQKSVEMTRPAMMSDATGVSYEPATEINDALPRLKALLADTKALVVRAEALVATMRDPKNYFRRY